MGAVQLTLGSGAVEVGQSVVWSVSHSPKHLLQPGITWGRAATPRRRAVGPTSTASCAASRDIPLVVILRNDDTNTDSNSSKDDKDDNSADNLRKKRQLRSTNAHGESTTYENFRTPLP